MPTPDPTIDGTVYYTSGIVFGSPISTAPSVTPAEATKSYQWQRSTDGGSTWTNIDGATNGKYTPVAADMGANVRIRVVVTAENYLGEIVGAPLTVNKAANNDYPKVIELEAVQDEAGAYTGFKINNYDPNCEYVYSETDTPKWNENQIGSDTVTGLTSDKTYYVFARFEETKTHTAGSIVSKNSIKLFGYVPLDRVLLEGYGSYGKIYIKNGGALRWRSAQTPATPILGRRSPLRRGAARKQVALLSPMTKLTKVARMPQRSPNIPSRLTAFLRAAQRWTPVTLDPGIPNMVGGMWLYTMRPMWKML